MKPSLVLLQRRSADQWLRGVPWRFDPIQTDESYWTFDRCYELFTRSATQLRDAAGRMFLKNYVRPHEVARTMPTASGHIVEEMAMPGFTRGPDLGPLVQLAPRGVQTVDSFSISTDQMIGGHSEALVDETEDNTLLFHGTLRVTRDPIRMTLASGQELLTEEHVGFASFEFCTSKVYRPTTTACRGFEIRCRGSMHPFHVKVQYVNNKKHEYYYHMFVPTDEWRSYILRYDHFRKVVYGSEVPSNTAGSFARVHTNPLHRFVTGINIGEEEDFWLEVDYVRFVTMSPEEFADGQKFGWQTNDNEHAKFG